MGKSVYSVVLSDEVVAAIDRLAYAEGLSRSRMMDRVLAEYAGCELPGQRMADIFDCIQQMVGLEQKFRLLVAPSEELLQLKSPMPYKYNPTVKYAVELYRSGPALGQLRVTLRSQSRPLLQALDQFFLLFAGLERESFRHGEQIAARIEEGRYLRQLRRIPGATGEEEGQAVAGYIQLLDGALQQYFGALPQGGRSAAGAAAESFAAALAAPVDRL